jgi:7-carboxy-7-deazaguanine synthase
MIVSEVFGPTVQGEGPSMGRLAGFVRLGRCDLACSWCDTPYTWDWKGRNGVAYDPAIELRALAVEEVVGQVEAMGVPLVVITGGEPLLQMRSVSQLCVALADRGHLIEVETNGRHAPAWPLTQVVTHFNVSPKLANSGQDEAHTIVPRALGALLASGKARFKFVCVDKADVDRVVELSAQLGIPASATWIMPEGRASGQVRSHLSQVAGAAIANHFNLTGRMHLDLWDGQRGH